MKVRRATATDAEPIATILAVVAEEGLIATEPPVDVAERTQRLAATLTTEGLSASWILEDAGQVVGSVVAHEAGPPGVLSLGMAILPEARGRGFRRRGTPPRPLSEARRLAALNPADGAIAR